ncbi:MAG: ribosomal RNA small subunit methyltransferase A [Phycisphaeraceae bacterium]|nr:ribosomal RNA small subunit methyltransferase A [Phycisphaeraceae bacterium]
MQTLTQIKEMLAARGLAPQKRFGQNFLIDHNLIRRLVDASGVRAGDLVLEVGPGTGALTEALLHAGAEVIAAEIDRGLSQLLSDRFGANPNFRLIEGDCLEGKGALAPALIEVLGGRTFSLVANLPYGAATPLMMALLLDHPACRGMWVTIQREVAERLAAGPGSKAYGPISVVAQALGEVRLLASLPPECFWPRPDVTSAMVEVRRRGEPLTTDAAGLGVIVQRAFGQRRKQLGSVLGKGVRWPEGIEPTMRAEQLSVGQFVSLTAAIADVGG